MKVSFCKVLFILFVALNSILYGSNKILILHSYHQTFDWTEGINKGITSVLDKCPQKLDLSIEYLDAKRYQVKILFELSAELFKEKYQNEEFDIIIAADNIALRFLNNYKNDLFPDVPVIFCGINNYHDSLTSNLTNVTGIIENIEIEESLNLALNLFKNTTDVVMITDTTETSKRILDKFFNEHNFNDNLKYHVLSNKSNSDIILKFKELHKRTVAFQVGYFINEKGEFDSYSKRMNSLSKSLDVPIFGIWDFYLDQGIIGGKLASAFKQGEAAAQVLLEVLNGVDIKKIPVKDNIEDFWGFDYKILKKFHIGESQLPEKSLIINRPDSFIKIDKNIIWTIGISLILLVVTIIALVLYIFAKRKVEVALRVAKENAEEADKLKSEFLAQISHEIRTPVNVMLSFTTILKEEFANHTSDDVKEIFKFIRRGAERLTRTIDLLINLSELNAGSIKLNKKITDLNEEIIKPIYDEYKVLAGKSNLEMVTDLDEGLDKIEIDPYMIKQVLINLVDNAIKYSEKGTIKLISSKDEFQNKFFSVEDQGIGMSQDYLDNIFKCFTQEEQGYTRKYEGTGLGLSLSKQYCELNSADLKVESEKGKGSKFTVVFNEDSP
ncbi:MAG: HAMP domain-containing sensor histidine kinase [Ignavibacteria bacterium]|jgi:signal transduction histidine kinase